MPVCLVSFVATGNAALLVASAAAAFSFASAEKYVAPRVWMVFGDMGLWCGEGVHLTFVTAAMTLRNRTDFSTLQTFLGIFVTSTFRYVCTIMPAFLLGKSVFVKKN